VTQDKVDTVFLAQIRDPVPAMHALDANDQVIAERGEQVQQRLRLGFDLLVKQYLAGVVNDAHIQTASVEVDSTVVMVGAIVEIHESSPL
jgi:hypothetical protein